MTAIHTAHIPPGDSAPIHYVAFVMLPHPDEGKPRDRFVCAATRLRLKASGVARRHHPAPFEQLTGGPARWTEIVNDGEHRLMDRRLPAAVAALRLLETRRSPHHRDERVVGDHSIARALGRDVRADDVVPADHHNARRLVWRASLPALPMTVALMVEAETLATTLRSARAAETLRESLRAHATPETPPQSRIGGRDCAGARLRGRPRRRARHGPGATPRRSALGRGCNHERPRPCAAAGRTHIAR